MLRSLAQQVDLTLGLRLEPKGKLGLDLVDRSLLEVLDAIVPVCGCDHSPQKSSVSFSV